MPAPVQPLSLAERHKLSVFDLFACEPGKNPTIRGATIAPVMQVDIFLGAERAGELRRVGWTFWLANIKSRPRSSRRRG